jgi:hypothetical protein
LIDFGAWEKKSWHLKHKSKNFLFGKKDEDKCQHSFQQQGTSFSHPFLLNSQLESWTHS